MGGTPYWLIILIAVGVLARRHMSSPTASDRSKKSVVWLTVGGCLLALVWPLLIIPVAILLAGVGVYVLLHREVSDHIEKTESEQLPRK